MLLHLRPRILCPGIDAKLLEFSIEPLGVKLRGRDLATGRPYPNKRLMVGMRRIGRKHVDGILIESPTWHDQFTITALWAINADYVATHKVEYRIIDRDFPAASDSMVLWYGSSAALGGWSNRWPKWAEGRFPADAEPKLDLREDWTQTKSEMFAMPTIEPERITDGSHEWPMPTLAMALQL